MPITDQDHYFMRAAIDLAYKGVWSTHPNPRVGCLVVKYGQVVGQGWHQSPGGPHAEVFALEDAGTQAYGATCYVTLEPCAHHGKTPPCVQALIKSNFMFFTTTATLFHIVHRFKVMAVTTFA